MSHPVGQLVRTAADARTDHENFHRQFGNIFDDEMTSAALVQPVAGETEYFCVFCDQRDFSGRDEARRHYQHHLEYYPILCSLCGSRATDLSDFLHHHTTSHPGCEKGKYKRREVPHMDRWLTGFLYAQSTIVSAFPPRDNCPVCDKVFTADQIANARPRRCTVNRKIDHVHRHLCYLPYECVKCRDEDGKEFLVAYFESRAHSHIKLKHPDVDDHKSRWYVFQKTNSIPKLDNFISNYLKRFGISMDIERRPIRKNNLSDIDQSGLSGDSDDNDMDDSDGFASEVPQTTDSVNCLVPVDASADSDTDATHHVDSKNEIVVPVSPDLVDLDYFCRRSHQNEQSSPYFCVFCPEKLDYPSRSHFGAHLDYHPIICLICEQRFDDIDCFSSHHKSVHEAHSDLKFEVREDFIIEKWIDEFIQFQKSNAISKLLLTCSCAKFCPSCSKINPNSMAPIACSSHSEVFFTDHLKHHLNYVQFVCLLCKQSDKLVRITNVTITGAAHIQMEHTDLLPQLVDRKFNQLFSKVLSIPKLDELIKSNIITRQALFSDSHVYPVRESRHLRVQIPIANPVKHVPPVSHSSNRMGGGANLRVITEGNRLVLKQFRPQAAKPISKSIPQPGTSHIRISGGRVINLPGSRPPQTQQRPKSNHFRVAPIPRMRHEPMTGNGQSVTRNGDKRIGHHRLLQPQTPGPAPGQSLIASSAAVHVTCVHCNKLYPSRRLLRLHSIKFHPGLSLATAFSDAR